MPAKREEGLKVIDIACWEREDHFNFFSKVAHPWFSVCFNIDVTRLHQFTKENGLSFYIGLVYASTEVINSLPSFLYRTRGAWVVQHKRVNPSFTDRKETRRLFHIVTLDIEKGEDMLSYCIRAKAHSAAQRKYFPSPENEGRDDLVYFSCLPRLRMTSLTNEMGDDRNDSVPRATWGKYEDRGGRLVLPYSLQVNHRLLDGLDVEDFALALQSYIDAL